MISIIIGLLFVFFAAFAVIPSFPLAWGSEVIAFLKGSLPVLAFFFGLICFFIGAADIKDKKEAKKEEKSDEE